MDLREQVDDLCGRTPPPRSELDRLDPSLRPALAWGARHHPSPATRRLCLDYLDHLADASTVEVLIGALTDPVPRVRRHAVHALACDDCKHADLCIDVRGPLRAVVAGDPHPRVRFEALRALLERLPGDERSALLASLTDEALWAEARRARPGAVPADLRAAAGA